jgi:hypothetical protein
VSKSIHKRLEYTRALVADSQLADRDLTSSDMFNIWQNVSGGFRLTHEGIDTLTKLYLLPFYEVKFQDMNSVWTSGELVRLDQCCPCPYYIRNTVSGIGRLIVLDRELATMGVLYGNHTLFLEYLTRLRA